MHLNLNLFANLFQAVIMKVFQLQIVQLDCPKSEEDHHLTSTSSCSSQESCHTDLSIKDSNLRIK